MSYYYNYTIGYMHEDKIYPLGPYNSFGKLKDVISKSRSFASDLHYSFWHIPEEMISDELRKEFEYEDWKGEKQIEVKYLPVTELPEGSFIKTGYFLIEDVEQYEQEHGDSYDLFYDHLSPTVYAAKAQNEARFGSPEKQVDEEGGDITPHSASEYMYYAYPDFNSKEYEAFQLRAAAEMLKEYGRPMPDGAVLVVLETEG